MGYAKVDPHAEQNRRKGDTHDEIDGQRGKPSAEGYFAFGDEGLALGICVYATTAFLQFTLGQWFWSRELTLSSLIRSPLIGSVILAFGIIAAGITPPLWIMRSTELMGSFTIPIMQFTLGVSLARLRMTHLGRTLWLSVLKILGGGLVGLGVANALGLEGIAAGVLVLDCAMPVAVFNYMFAEKYGRSPTDVASVIVLSTLLSFGTLPLLLSFLID